MNQAGYFLNNEDIKKKRHSFHILRDLKKKSYDCTELAKQDGGRGQRIQLEAASRESYKLLQTSLNLDAEGQTGLPVQSRLGEQEEWTSHGPVPCRQKQR